MSEDYKQIITYCNTIITKQFGNAKASPALYVHDEFKRELTAREIIESGILDAEIERFVLLNWDDNKQLNDGLERLAKYIIEHDHRAAAAYSRHAVSMVELYHRARLDRDSDYITIENAVFDAFWEEKNYLKKYIGGIIARINAEARIYGSQYTIIRFYALELAFEDLKYMFQDIDCDLEEEYNEVYDDFMDRMFALVDDGCTASHYQDDVVGNDDVVISDDVTQEWDDITVANVDAEEEEPDAFTQEWIDIAVANVSEAEILSEEIELAFIERGSSFADASDEADADLMDEAYAD